VVVTGRPWAVRIYTRAQLPSTAQTARGWDREVTWSREERAGKRPPHPWVGQLGDLVSRRGTISIARADETRLAITTPTSRSVVGGTNFVSARVGVGDFARLRLKSHPRPAMRWSRAPTSAVAECTMGANGRQRRAGPANHRKLAIWGWLALCATRLRG